MTIDAPISVVHALINDLHAWARWSPWEDLSMRRTWTGPSAGVGSIYAWRGNTEVGTASMEITNSTPERIDLDLAIIKPMATTSRIAFLLDPVTDGSTHVTWQITHEMTLLSRLFNVLHPVENLLGGGFERGLSSLKRLAETG